MTENEKRNPANGDSAELLLERLKNELLDPLIDRAFNLLARQGMLPTPPESIQGMPLKVEYVSMIAQAQKAAGLSSLIQGLNYAATLAAAKPELTKRVDYDCALEEGLKALGVAPALLKSEDEITPAGSVPDEVNSPQAADEVPTSVSQDGNSPS